MEGPSLNGQKLPWGCGLSPQSPHRREVGHLDVGSSHPGWSVPRVEAVRPLKRYASWVQNVVRQFGPYPSWRRKFEEEPTL